MIKNLPLFYYPSTWLLIDDDRLILESISHYFSQYNRINTFESSKACQSFLKTYQSPLSQQAFLRSKTEDELYGALQHAPVDFDVTLLARLADLPTRHDEITVMVIDYNMPDINGFALAQASEHLPMYKICLTGAAKPSQAVAGFNQKIIHGFVEKGEEDMVEKLLNHLNQLTLQYFQTKTLHLLSHLEADMEMPLSDPVFIDFFNHYCEEHKIKEYYLLDKQGSFLCIDSEKKRSVLVVQTDNSLDDWLKLHSEYSELSEFELTMIANREKIPFAGIGKENWEIVPSELVNFLHAPQILEGKKRYYWSKINHI